MTTPSRLRRPPNLLVPLAALLFAACGGTERDTGGGLKRRTDAGVAVDAGGSTGDAGPGGSDGGNDPSGCGANPNGCAPNELVGAPPECACLNICASGFVWNAASERCDPTSGPRPDGGVNPGGRDGGTEPPPPPNGCSSAADCAAPNNRCISISGGDDCSGEGDCQCFVGCTPFSAQSACPQGADCRWFGSVSEGVCIQDDQGSTTNGGPCTVQFDPRTGDVQSDSCSFSQNFFCAGASEESPTGVCVSLCATASGNPCASLGNFRCEDIMNASFPGLGLCLAPPPNHNDYGRACMSDGQCQGGICSQLLAGSCSAPCDGLTPCAAGGLCLNLTQFGEGVQCATECTPGAQGDSFCAGRNMDTICENIAQQGDPPVGVCLPRCTDDAQCQGGMCVNGRCV